VRTFAAVHESGSGTKETVSPVAKGCCGREMVYAQRTKPRVRSNNRSQVVL
jgi:hypothetical protein